jgi:hypothetical protein
MYRVPACRKFDSRTSTTGAIFTNNDGDNGEKNNPQEPKKV